MKLRVEAKIQHSRMAPQFLVSRFTLLRQLDEEQEQQ